MLQISKQHNPFNLFYFVLAEKATLLSQLIFTDRWGWPGGSLAWDAPVIFLPPFVRLLPREILAHTEAMPHRELFDWAFFEEEQTCLFVFIHFVFILVKEFYLLEIWRHFVFGECQEYFAAPADWQFCLLLGNYERIITVKLAFHLFWVETWGRRGYSASVIFRIFMGFTLSPTIWYF